MRILLRIVGIFVVWAVITGALSYTALTHRDAIKQVFNDRRHAIFAHIDDTKSEISRFSENTTLRVYGFFHETGNSLATAQRDFNDDIDITSKGVSQKFADTESSIKNFLHTKIDQATGFIFSFLEVPEEKLERKRRETAYAARQSGIVDATYNSSMPPPPLTLSEIKKRKSEGDLSFVTSIEPAAAPSWQPEQASLDVEAVLVPRQVTVISSSQDGRIAEIPVNHGDIFKKGDLLIAYDCADVRAEADIVKIEKEFTRKRLQGSDKLFKLDIISDLDRSGAQVEDEKADAKRKLFEARMQDCEIRAGFDGRVTNRLANPGEYTRTDRVLLEVASKEALQAEFLIPSKWLRWVNIGAPITITISETEKTYTARIQRIHGEVDPVSQSIQVIATLDPYNDPLLPGMSGSAVIDVNSIRDAGIVGYLETGTSSN